MAPVVNFSLVLLTLKPYYSYNSYIMIHLITLCCIKLFTKCTRELPSNDQK